MVPVGLAFWVLSSPRQENLFDIYGKGRRLQYQKKQSRAETVITTATTPGCRLFIFVKSIMA